MLSKVLTTPVDDLVTFLEEKKSLTISEIQKHLKIPTPTIERWLVILEEFNVIDVSYKGFDGIVSLKQKNEKNEEIDLDKLKNTFIEKGKRKSYSYDKMRTLWPIFLQEYKPEIRTLFFKKAQERGFNNTKTQQAWKKFEEALQQF